MKPILTLLFALFIVCGTTHAQSQDNVIQLKLERFAVKRSTGFGVQMIGMVVAGGGLLLSKQTEKENYLYAAGAGIFVTGWIIQWDSGRKLRN